LNFQNQKAHLPSTRGLLMRFGTMGTMPTRLEEKEQGVHHESPTRPKDLGQEAHYRGALKDKH
jgi:hypothetical protein